LIRPNFKISFKNCRLVGIPREPLIKPMLGNETFNDKQISLFVPNDIFAGFKQTHFCNVVSISLGSNSNAVYIKLRKRGSLKVTGRKPTRDRGKARADDILETINPGGRLEVRSSVP
jgi:hypothetical protein